MTARTQAFFASHPRCDTALAVVLAAGLLAYFALIVVLGCIVLWRAA